MGHDRWMGMCVETKNGVGNNKNWWECVRKLARRVPGAWSKRARAGEREVGQPRGLGPTLGVWD